MNNIHMIVAAFCLNAAFIGPIKSFGPFFMSFERSLNATAGQVSLVSSLIWGTMFLGGPLASFLARTFGYRKTMVFGSSLLSISAIISTFSKSIISMQIFAVIMGLGCCFTGIPCSAVLGYHFKEKRSFANNVMTMGGTLISIPLSPLVQLWIDEYTWRGAMLLIGALMLNSVPSCLLLTTNISKDLKSKTSMDAHILKSLPFLIYVTACGCNIAAALSYQIYLIRFAQSRGMNDYYAAVLQSVLSFVDLSLRPISGYVTSLSNVGPIPIQRIYILSGLTLIQSFVILSLTFCWTIETMIVATVLYATVIGCQGALALTVTADLFGGRDFVNALGWRYLVMGVFSIAAPPLMGRMVEARGSYASPFYASAALALVSGSLILVVKMLVNKRDSEVETTNNEAQRVMSQEKQVELAPK